MPAQVQKILDQIKEYYQKMNAKTRRIIILCVAAMLVISIVIVIILNNQPYETLFADLNDTEATEIMGKLDEMGVTYRYEGDGTILVPRSQEPTTKAQLISEGYPKSGLTYSIFTNNISLMTTDSERRQYLIFDLQDRIAATIRCFDGVKDAIVTIAIGEEQRYVLQESVVTSTASVVVLMKDGGSPPQWMVEGIINLVSRGVPGALPPENVTVLDGNGRDVSGSGSGSTTTKLGATELKLSLEQQINKIRADEISFMLGPIFGRDKIRVTVRSTVDIDKKIREIINYYPSGDGNTGVVSGESHSAEIVRGDDGEGGTAGTESNSEVPYYPGVTVDGTEVYFSSTDDIDYLVSQMMEQIESDSYVITDMSVSIAIDAPQLSAERVTEIKNLVGNIAGIAQIDRDAKIAILSDQFIVEEITQPEPTPFDMELFLGFTLGDVILYGGIALLVILFIIIVLTSIKKGKRKKQVREIEELARLTSDGTPDIGGELIDYTVAPIIERSTRESELRNQIGDFAKSNPAIAAQLIRTWLKGVEE